MESRKKRSLCWLLFDEIDQNAQCNLCKKEFSYKNGKKSTSAMKRHLQTKQMEKTQKIKEDWSNCSFYYQQLSIYKREYFLLICLENKKHTSSLGYKRNNYGNILFLNLFVYFFLYSLLFTIV